MRQDRVSGQALSHPSASAGATAEMNGHPAPPRAIVLSLCLRTLDSRGSPAAVSWASDSPAPAVAFDIIAASGGAPDAAQGVFLPSRFFDSQSALLAARRLLWALEGLAESVRSTTIASMAIYSVEDPAAASALAALETLPPGQVLLSAELAETVQGLPGFVVSAAGSGSWRTLQWQSQNAATSQSADEQSVLGLIRGLGREDPCPPRSEPAPPAQVAAPMPPASGIFEAPATLGRSFMGSEAAQPFWKKPWIIVSGAGAVVVLVAALVIPAMVSGNRSRSLAQVALPKIASPSAPQNVTPTGAGPVVTEKPRDQKPPAKIGKQSRMEGKAPTTGEPVPQPKPAVGSCDLTEGEIPRSLSRAESLMYAGKLEEAQDAFQQLVGCPSAHDKAAEGLRQVKQRIAAQSSSVP